MLKRVYNQNRCTGCGICTINCPQKILKISEIVLTAKKN